VFRSAFGVMRPANGRVPVAWLFLLVPQLLRELSLPFPHHPIFFSGSKEPRQPPVFFCFPGLPVSSNSWIRQSARPKWGLGGEPFGTPRGRWTSGNARERTLASYGGRRPFGRCPAWRPTVILAGRRGNRSGPLPAPLSWWAKLKLNHLHADGNRRTPVPSRDAISWLHVLQETLPGPCAPGPPPRGPPVEVLFFGGHCSEFSILARR